MKYLKSYHLFNEALKPSQFRKYVRAFNKKRYAEIFKQIGDYKHLKGKIYYKEKLKLKVTESLL